MIENTERSERTNISTIEKVVMRRVRAMRVLRIIFSNGALSFYVLGIALWGIGREVWVAKVFANGPQDLFGHVQYLTYAFAHTHFSVELLVLTTLAALIILARESARLLASLLFTTARI